MNERAGCLNDDYRTYIAENKSNLAHDGDALREEWYRLTALVRGTEDMGDKTVRTQGL